MTIFKKAVCQCGYNSRIGKDPARRIRCPKCKKFLTIRPNWVIEWKYKNKKKTRTIGPDRKLASQVLNQVETKIFEGNYKPQNDIYWEDAVQIFKQDILINCQPSTVAFYEQNLRVIENYFKPSKLSDFTVQAIKTFYVDRLEKVGPVTINRTLATLRKIFYLAESETEFLIKNPFKKWQIPIKREKRRQIFLDDSQKQKLLNSCHHDEIRLAVQVALLSGMRSGEIFSMAWKDISFKNQEILIPKTKEGKPKKIPMSDRLAAVLSDYKQKQPVIYKHVFPGKIDKQKPVCDLRRSWVRVKKQAGLQKIHFHDLRHTFAIDFLKFSRGDIYTLSKILGHSQVTTTEIYLHALDDHKKEQIKNFDPVPEAPEAAKILDFKTK